MLLRSLLLLRTCLAVAVCTLLPAVQGGASLTIETIPAWDGQSFVGSFGERNTATYGQTVTAPGNVLQSFKFLVDDSLNPDFVDFEAFVYAWDGAKAAGPALYTSAPMSTTNNGGQGGYEEIELLTGGVPVVTGGEYVLFLSVSNLFDGSVGLSNWRLR